MRRTETWETRAAELARVAERYATALLTARAGDRAAILDGLRAASHERDTLRGAVALQRRRDGEGVWAWPASAPWAGF